MARLIIAMVLLGASSHAYSQDIRPKDTRPLRPRRYEDGPLQVKEFLGKPDLTLGGHAYTACSVEFDFTYRITESDATFTATLATFDAFAIFLPRKSWWSRRAASELLDHEQGHFDIAETTARRLQYTFDTALSGERTLAATGVSSDEAIKALQQKIQRVLKVANEQTTQNHIEYDNRTVHGMRYGRQAEYRRIQKAELARLAKKLAALSDAQ